MQIESSTTGLENLTVVPISRDTAMKVTIAYIEESPFDWTEAPGTATGAWTLVDKLGAEDNHQFSRFRNPVYLSVSLPSTTPRRREATRSSIRIRVQVT
jgi:hypothetical protein